MGLRAHCGSDPSLFRELISPSRTIASALLNAPPAGVIEVQPAHAEHNEERAAYNKAQRLPERRNCCWRRQTAWPNFERGGHSSYQARSAF